MAVATVFDTDKEKSKPKKPKPKKGILKPESTVVNLGELPKRAVSAYSSNVNVSLYKPVFSNVGGTCNPSKTR